MATHALLSLPHCRLREHHRATIRVVRRMQYFVAKKKFQVSPALSPLLCPRSPSRPWWRLRGRGPPPRPRPGPSPTRHPRRLCHLSPRQQAAGRTRPAPVLAPEAPPGAWDMHRASGAHAPLPPVTGRWPGQDSERVQSLPHHLGRKEVGSPSPRSPPHTSSELLCPLSQPA